MIDSHILTYQAVVSKSLYAELPPLGAVDAEDVAAVAVPAESHSNMVGQ